MKSWGAGRRRRGPSLKAVRAKHNRLTADTITDEQIRELRRSTAGLTVAPHVIGLCDLALSETEEARIVLALKPHKRKQARARCAEILNARGGK